MHYSTVECLDSSRAGRRDATHRHAHGQQQQQHQHQSQGKRVTGQNVNHLLSFTLPPRSRPPLAGPPRRSRRGGASAPFNKERYVNAQYRFLVKPTGDYTAYFADPDIYLNWADILQVIIPTTSALAGVGSSAPIADQPREPSHEGAACPICLSPPTAPRMTKCGHVFCYPCILRYLTLADGNAAGGSTGNAPSQKWRRCPICWDAVYARDLKAVRWWDPRAAAKEHEVEVREEHELQEARRISQMAARSSEADMDCSSAAAMSGTADEAKKSTAAALGEMLALRLIERPHVTTLALPQSSTWPASHLDHPLIAAHSAPWHFQPDVMGFAKFMLATPDLLIDSLTGDLHELDEEIKTRKGFGGDELGLQFVSVAQQKVSEQIHKVQTELDLPIIRSTIGRVRNDMKEHQAAEAGQSLRLDLSRRQRKRMERDQNPETDNENASTDYQSADATASQNEKADATDDAGLGRPEAAVGAEEFLAFRAQSQGGRIAVSSQSDAKPSSGADDEKKVETHGAASGEDANENGGGNKAASGSGRGPKPRRNVNPPMPGSSSYVFYQAASGQSIFLHPLDIKILLSHFGAYAKLPRDLAVKVSGADEGSMNEELRRRCKYLNHIPMAADVVFIEVDWEAMDLIKKSTLKPYEQGLRQRRNRRRDKERREDRAKTKAEEAELINSQGGPAAAAAYRRRQEEIAAFTSEANFPSGGLSRSFDGNQRPSGGGGYATDEMRPSEMSTSPYGGEYGGARGGAGGGFSPSFRESAMVGAEREYPIHPGTVEDFPDSLGGTRSGIDRVSISSDDQSRDAVNAERSADAGAGAGSGGRGAGNKGNSRASGAAPVTSAKKTVWGTPAARSSFASAIQGRGGRSNDAHGLWDDTMEDAWHELEEDFILSAGESGRRPHAVKESRGLNRQPSSTSSTLPTSHTAASKPTASRHPSANKVDSFDADTESTSQPQSQSQPLAARSKKVKKKLILTGGGGGRGAR
ncbi:hypothetical protein BCV70DRAFT_227468 [Testicularia cyperi]|uniref:RING-type domain-containing protein n=1 Tax=Testicularia cyperi TaxID=1882483 RepID=A0A317XL92_9BASI|nr:hypothetical protein BCV70DRAFT_227468 [Testicularia cyperi]